MAHLYTTLLFFSFLFAEAATTNTQCTFDN